uniref:Protein phosphatase 1 regulatory subunit 15A/B C-terminal domain-containing protein n=1 Tax=Mola mola TaxID=94237 RepID=A0A3Q3WQM6_MOLML
MSQEVKPGLGDWVPKAGGSSVKHDGGNWIWWGNFSGSEESSLKGLMSHLSWPGEENPTGPLCPQPALAETKAPTVFVQSGRGWMLAENPRLPDQKEQLAINGNLHTAQNREGSVLDQCSSITNHLSCPDAACPELSVLTPDLDNGYSSLEEEHLQMCRLLMVKAPSAVQPTETPPTAKTDKEEESLPANVEEEDEEEEERKAAAHYQSAEVTALTSSQCQNKAIAFIMGCPCSDDDSSQSDGESSAGDDDGFDSEGSSDLSESSDEDNDESSNSEADSETERFWSSLCRSVDPYSPRNFTAQLHTSSTPPRTIPAVTPPSSNQSSPASSPDLTPLLLSSPPPVSDVWDESTSASEADEAENLRLWSSFSCTSDPYSPLNFQAPLRTCGLVQTTSRARAKKLPHMPPPTPCHDKTSPSKYRMEEWLDSGFAEPSTFCRTSKKVSEVIGGDWYGAEEEDRRGPWEELARDRCRFLRRCQEVEQSIAYCLQPQHRRQVYRRLAVFLDPEDVGRAGLHSTSLD